nr:hypothetical protein CFP56_43723 [Quercus suber]
MELEDFDDRTGSRGWKSFGDNASQTAFLQRLIRSLLLHDDQVLDPVWKIDMRSFDFCGIILGSHSGE